MIQVMTSYPACHHRMAGLRSACAFNDSFPEIEQPLNHMLAGAITAIEHGHQCSRGEFASRALARMPHYDGIDRLEEILQRSAASRRHRRT